MPLLLRIARLLSQRILLPGPVPMSALVQAVGMVLPVFLIVRRERAQVFLQVLCSGVLLELIHLHKPQQGEGRVLGLPKPHQMLVAVVQPFVHLHALRAIVTKVLRTVVFQPLLHHFRVPVL